jgi:hypothetical protein
MKSITYFGQLSNVLENYQMLWATIQIFLARSTNAFFRAGWGWGEGVCAVKAILWTGCCCQKYAPNLTPCSFVITHFESLKFELCQFCFRCYTDRVISLSR